jgi:hypothetical protein
MGAANAVIMPIPKQQFWGVTGSYMGKPLAGGLVYTCVAGGTIANLQTSYTDATAATQNPNPVILDSQGMANIWLTPATYYKIFVYDANSVLQYSVDNIV